MDWIAQGDKIANLSVLMLARGQDTIESSFDGTVQCDAFNDTPAERLLMAAGRKVPGLRVKPMGAGIEAAKRSGMDLSHVSAFSDMFAGMPRAIYIRPEAAFLNGAGNSASEHFLRTAFHELGHCSMGFVDRHLLHFRPYEEAVAEIAGYTMLQELVPEASADWSINYLALYLRNVVAMPTDSPVRLNWVDLIELGEQAYQWQRPLVLEAAKEIGFK